MVPVPDVSKRERERAVLRDFFGDFDPDGGWTLIEERDRPDFFVGYAGSRVGIEVTEALEPESGRQRALERAIATVIREAVRRALLLHGGKGAIVDGALHALPKRRSDIADIGRRFEEHLARHGAALARDGRTVHAEFRFEWGYISHVQRTDWLGEVNVYAGFMHSTTSTARDPSWLQDAIVEAVREKVAKVPEYDRTYPLWLVVRNPYSHVPYIVPEAQGIVSTLNAGLFSRIYLHDRKMNTVDASPPRPRVLVVLGD